MHLLHFILSADTPLQPRGRYPTHETQNIVQSLEDALLSCEEPSEYEQNEGLFTHSAPSSGIPPRHQSLTFTESDYAMPDEEIDDLPDDAPFTLDEAPAEKRKKTPKRVHFLGVTPPSGKLLRRESFSKSSENIFDYREDNQGDEIISDHGSLYLSDSDTYYDRFPDVSIGPNYTVTPPVAMRKDTPSPARVYSPTSGLSKVRISSSGEKRSTEAEGCDASGILGLIASLCRRWLSYVYHADVSTKIEEPRKRPVSAQDPFSRVKVGGDVGEWQLSEEDFAKPPNAYLREIKGHPGVCFARKPKFPVLYRSDNEMELRIQIRREARRYFGLLIHKFLEVARKWKCHTLCLPDLDPDSIQWYRLEPSRGLVKRTEVTFDRFYIPQNYERIFFESLIRRMPDRTRSLLQDHFQKGPWVSSKQYDQSLEIRFGFLCKKWDRGRIASIFSFVNLNADFFRTLFCWCVLGYFVISV